MLKALLGLAAREDATTAELAPSLPAAEAELAAAQAAMAAAKEAFRASLLQPDEARSQQLDAAHGEARVRVKRAEALVAALHERLATAREREAQAVKLQRYEAATRRAGEMREVLVEMYPVAAQAVVDIIRALAETEIEVAAANADLPAGMAKIPSVEVSVRAISGSPVQLVSETAVERWCYPGDGRPDAVGQDRVEVQPDGSGLLRHNRGGVEHLVKRKFIERRFTAFAAPEVPERLAIAINLPGVGARDPAFFAPLDRQGRTDPDAVLKHLDRPRAVASSTAKGRETVKWELVGSVDANAERRRYAGLLDRIAGRV